MVFRILGQLACRAWPFVLIAWVVLLVALAIKAPPWAQVAGDREFAFLPADAPSRQAADMLAKAFPDNHSASNIVLVLRRSDDSPESLARDERFTEETLEPALRQIADESGGLASEPRPSDQPLFSDEPQPAKSGPKPVVSRIRTPNAPSGGAFLVSPDRRALLVEIELTNEFLSAENWPTITKVEQLIANLRETGKIPPGLDITITGSAVVGRDHSRAQSQSVRATQTLTFVLVIGLLIVIYRAPLVALIPLATVFVAVQVAMRLLSILAGGGYMILFEGIQIYITILAYGAGVDYCLFLTARYREELDRGRNPAEAVTASIAAVGPALAASAAAVIGGIFMMYFARFGKFREAGLAIPLSLLLVLCATLTFSPALLRLAGPWAFWPQHPGARPTESARHQGWRRWLSYGSDCLEGFWDRVGQLLLRRAGTVWLVTVAAMAPFAVIAGLTYYRLSYDMVGDLPASAPSVAGTAALKVHFPAGIMGPVTILMVDPTADFGKPEGRAIVERLTNRLHEHQQELGVADVRSLTAPLGFTEAAQSDPFAGLSVPKNVALEATKRGALDYYTTDMGERGNVGARIDVVLDRSPFSHTSVEALNRLQAAARDALPAEVRQQTRLYFPGTTASVSDLSNVIRGDRSHIQMLVLGAVFVILVLLLRRVLVPVYLLASVLFSYMATLGVAFTVFWLIDPRGFTGIDWKVAIFLFTILIAVGADYNIFLMTRIHEEQRRHGPILGITRALDRTGPIISSCGIIMAGTFASLLAGSLTDIKELGFALAFGVLLDTFVVRPILVPAFLILWQRGQVFPWMRARFGQGTRTSALHGPAASS
jgi:RND superfamily putative drug exporter